MKNEEQPLEDLIEEIGLNNILNSIADDYFFINIVEGLLENYQPETPEYKALSLTLELYKRLKD